MSYQLEDGWSSVNFVRPAHGLVALHGADVVNGQRARPHVGPQHARPPLRSADGPGGAARRRPLRAAAGSPRRGDRRLRPPPRRHRAPVAACRRAARPDADRRRGAARRSDRAGRAAERAAVPVRARVPRRAERVPDPDDEGQPEVLSAARCERGADEQVPRRQQHPPRRPERDRARQRARRASAAGGCEVLLRPGSQEDAWSRACRCSTRWSITPSSARRASACSACVRLPVRSASSSVATRWRNKPTALRNSPRPTSSPTWSASSPNCKA